MNTLLTCSFFLPEQLLKNPMLGSGFPLPTSLLMAPNSWPTWLQQATCHQNANIMSSFSFLSHSFALPSIFPAALFMLLSGKRKKKTTIKAGSLFHETPDIHLQPQRELKVISWFLADNRKDQLETEHRHLWGGSHQYFIAHWLHQGQCGSSSFKTFTYSLGTSQESKAPQKDYDLGSSASYEAPPLLSRKRIIAVPSVLP